MKISTRTDPGRQRQANEDALAVLDVAQLGLPVDAAFVVADGMGGMEGGDTASREAVRVVQKTLVQILAEPNADPQATLVEALRRANETIYTLARNRVTPDDAPTAVRGGSGQTDGREAAGLMGTTCVAGVVADATLYLAHVGDSRAYFLREGRLSRLTRDHSFVEERVLAGDLTEEEARTSRFRNMITRAIGIEAEVEPELRKELMRAGDTLLVCTDGLTTMLRDADIEATLANACNGGAMNLEQAAGALVDAANRKGGADNITVLLLHAAASAASSLPINHAAQGPPAHRGAPPLRREVLAKPEQKESPRRWAPGAPSVVDLDAHGRGVTGNRRRRSPFLRSLALLGALALLLAIALLFSPSLRGRVFATLGAPAPSGTVTHDTRDLARVTYSVPELFTKYLARGDVLSYSPRGYLYFVKDSSGRIAYLSRTGEVLGSVATLRISPPLATPISPTHTFVTTDVQGNGYISYTSRKVIEKYDPQGRLLATIKGLQRPEAIAVDEDGNLYVVDFNQVKILRVRPPKPDGAIAGAAPAPATRRPGPDPAGSDRVRRGP